MIWKNKSMTKLERILPKKHKFKKLLKENKKPFRTSKDLQRTKKKF